MPQKAASWENEYFGLKNFLFGLQVKKQWFFLSSCPPNTNRTASPYKMTIWQFFRASGSGEGSYLIMPATTIIAAILNFNKPAYNFSPYMSGK